MEELSCLNLQACQQLSHWSAGCGNHSVYAFSLPGAPLLEAVVAAPVRRGLSEYWWEIDPVTLLLLALLPNDPTGLRLIPIMQSNHLSQWDMSMLAPSVTIKTDELLDHAKDGDLDILAITETWLRKDPTDAMTTGELTHGPYSLIHVPRPKRRGGGVAILFKSELNLRRMSTSTFQSFELMEAKLTSSIRTFIFLVVNCPPSGQETTFLEEFAALIDSYMTTAGHLIIVGDFNMHWESLRRAVLSSFMTCHLPWASLSM